MKRIYTLLVLLALAFPLFSQVSTPTNPFLQKKRTTAPWQAVHPKQVMAVPSINSSAGQTRTFAIPSYQPAQANLASLYISSQFEDYYFNKNGQLIFLKGAVAGSGQLNSESRELAEQACYEYLDVIKEAMKIKDPESEFSLESVNTDELGMQHFKMQQVFQGIPVWCAEIYLHSSSNQVDLFNGTYYPTPAIQDLDPAISANEAISTVIDDLPGRTTFRQLSAKEKEFLNYEHPEGELVIYHKDRNPLNPCLAWHVSVRPNFMEIWDYFIDAETGQIVHFYNSTHYDGDVTASGPDLNGVSRNIHAYLENGTYYLVDISRPMFNPQNFEGVLAIYDAGYTNPANPDFNASIASSGNNSWSPTSISAMYNAAVTYEYFRTVNNRNSYNNQGGSLNSIIHVSDENGGGFDNAFWNGAAVFYGDGAQQFDALAGGLDVGAHEFGHAYEGAASNLEYQGQSGAIAESYADIAGSMVERQNWTIGEQVVNPAFYPSGCLRNMADPHNGGSGLSDPGWQPSNTNEMYNGSEDNGGVHINSGIPNNAYYRLATAIGNEKAEKIFWRACFMYNTRSTQFIDLRLNTIQAAKDLFGGNSSEQSAVGTAFDQVGIGNGQGGNYQTELQVNPGQDYILFYDLISNDPNSLYVCSTSGTDFIPLTQTEVNNKPSIVDDGSYALFISSDNKMRSLQLSQSPVENIIQNESMWHNVAVAKDGTKLSAITIYEDSTIWVYSYQLQQWATFHLYNPTTAEGEGTNTVVYADAMEWDYSGEYVMYDALSRIENPNGDPIEYWDISFLKVWDNASNNWGSGEIFKLFGSLPAGISVGNPSFSKNSPFIFGFDLLDASDNSVIVGATNVETGDVGQIFMNDGILGTPNYSKLDDQVIFTVPDGNSTTIAIIDMQENKLIPSSENAYALITEAKWGMWFSQGSRPLLGLDENKEDLPVYIYPNPASDKVTLSFGNVPAAGLNIKIFDVSGRCVGNYENIKKEHLSLDISKLPEGLYLFNISSGRSQVSKKLMVR